MMTEQAKVPAIRFAGFTDPWEQRKLGELYKEVSEKNDLTYGKDRIISVAHMYFNPVVYVTEDDYLKTYNVMRLGDIAFEGNRSKNFAHGRLVENTIGDGIVSHVFKVFRPIQPFDLMYWKYSINNEKAMKDVLTRSTKASTMMHELVAKDFLNEEIAVPSLEEQRQIGGFFDRLDSLITLHQRKYDKLVIFKKSMLEKMFPKDGESVPEIRFAGFTDPWEQRKLGELSSEFQSGDFISAEEILGSGPYPVYGGNGLRGYAKQYNHDGFYALIGRQGALCGNVNTAVGKAYFTEHAVAVKANFLHDTRFLAHLLGCMDLGRYSGQSAQPGLAVGVLKEVETTVPSKAEQQAIGSFFSRLDSLITLHQRKLELLQNIKKSLLDKMFV
jgi:restriction endonuclease S subunit